MKNGYGDAIGVIYPLVTWLDVERRFREMTRNGADSPDSVVSVSCYCDGVTIYVATKHLNSKTDGQVPTDILNWLTSGFKGALSDDGRVISLAIGDAPYPIDIEFVLPSSRKEIVRYPLWYDLAYITDKEAGLNHPPSFTDDSIRLAAFHSFKGGVGRTTALMTYLAAYLKTMARNPAKVLVIDADLEAPGITYWLEPANRPSVSFIGFLEALHYPPTSIDDTFDYFAAELRKTSLTIQGQHDIFILPACVNPNLPTELMDAPVLPEHLVKNPKNPWLVGEYIRRLADSLGAKVVFIDLRAGLSELSSPLLFDPRIERFAVTTVAKQSIEGVAHVLSKMSQIQKYLIKEEASIALPTVIISLLTKQLRESSDYAEAIRRLNEAFPSPITDDAISSGLDFVESGFAQELMSISGFQQALELVPINNPILFTKALSWAESLRRPSESTRQSSLRLGRSEQAKLLEEICKKYQFAEKGEGENLLVTDPIRNFAKHYSKSLPNAISIGSKGAGKTFIFLQICRAKVWEGFLKKIKRDSQGEVQENNSEDILVFPFLSSRNLEDSIKSQMLDYRKNCCDLLELPDASSESDLLDNLKNAYGKGGNWETFWIKQILSTFGVEGESLEDFSRFLAKKNKSLVLLFDGIEDNFPQVRGEGEQAAAVEALLRLPNRIAEIRNSRIGMIGFVRADYVRSVITQNVAQFEERYSAFKLEWTAESFLRLAYWICAEVGLPWVNPNETEILSSEELLEKLYELWGKKLGSSTSKEAMSAKWVFAALCDLNGRLQARDLIRFLGHAAYRSKNKRDSRWDDRVLLPEAIRRAVEDSSKNKVQEAINEIDVLRQWYEALSNIPPASKTVPFLPEDVGLSPSLANSLQELGVIFEDSERYNAPRFYLPESYRTGLGFQLSAGARPRVLALIQRNLVNLPF